MYITKCVSLKSLLFRILFIDKTLENCLKPCWFQLFLMLICKLIFPWVNILLPCRLLILPFIYFYICMFKKISPPCFSILCYFYLFKYESHILIFESGLQLGLAYAILLTFYFFLQYLFLLYVNFHECMSVQSLYAEAKGWCHSLELEFQRVVLHHVGSAN